MANEDIRKTARLRGVRLWEVAARLGLSDSAFSRRLRFALPDAMRNQILNFIDDIARERVPGVCDCGA